MYLILLNLTLKNGQKSKFCYVHFTAIKKKLKGHENPGVRESIKEAVENLQNPSEGMIWLLRFGIGAYGCVLSYFGHVRFFESHGL